MCTHEILVLEAIADIYVKTTLIIAELYQT